jgi:hypothetical protein
MASSRDAQHATPSGRSSAARAAAGSRDRTTFTRPPSGRNLGGMLSHVFRPITTPFSWAPGASVVTRLK